MSPLVVTLMAPQALMLVACGVYARTNWLRSTAAGEQAVGGIARDLGDRRCAALQLPHHGSHQRAPWARGLIRQTPHRAGSHCVSYEDTLAPSDSRSKVLPDNQLE